VISTLLWLAGAVLAAAGVAMVVRGFAGRAAIRGELADQRIVFPDSAALPAGLARHAGAAVRTGAQARAFADFIGQNLTRITAGRSYAQISDEWHAGGRGDARLAELREAAFAGQMLRGSLLGAYQAWQVTVLVIGLGGLFCVLGVVLFALAGSWR
jgi:hypothetical protein